MIVIQCACGKRLKAQDEQAGRRMRCPACGATVVVTAAAELAPAAGAVAAPAAPVRTTVAAPAVRPAPATADPLSRGLHVPPTDPRLVRRGPVTTASPRFRLSLGLILLIAALIVVPVVLYLIANGPVKGVRDWSAVKQSGADDVRSVVMRVILDLDKALMPPPDPDAEGTGINYHPDVLRFEWMDPPTFMWRMPDTVEFTGDTTFGPFKGIYKTRTRECDGYMTYKFRVVQFSGESSDDWARAKAKGIQTTDKPAITSAAESGQLWSDEKIERPKLRVIVP